MSEIINRVCGGKKIKTSLDRRFVMHYVSDRENSILHLVVGFNGRKMIFISAYRPDNEHWEDDYKTRKEK